MVIQQDETRWLICEGNCNPDLYDYDTTVARMRTGAAPVDLIDYTRYMVRILRHTIHVRAGRNAYNPGTGFVDKWKCAECGYTRKF